MPQLLDLPLLLWEQKPTPSLDVYDEFHVLLVVGMDLDRLLRSRMKCAATPPHVEAGSEPSTMPEVFDEVPNRPFFGHADHQIELTPMLFEETLTELAARFAVEELALGNALGELVVFADGPPHGRCPRATRSPTVCLLDGAARPQTHRPWALVLISPGSARRSRLASCAGADAKVSSAVASDSFDLELVRSMEREPARDPERAPYYRERPPRDDRRVDPERARFLGRTGVRGTDPGADPRVREAGRAAVRATQRSREDGR
jgi:hypothetical protein